MGESGTSATHAVAFKDRARLLWALTALGSCAFGFAAVQAGHGISVTLAALCLLAVILMIAIAREPSFGLVLLIVSIPLVSVGVIEAGWSIRPAHLAVIGVGLAVLIACDGRWSPLPVHGALLVYIGSIALAGGLAFVGSGAGIGVTGEAAWRGSSLRPLAQFVSIGLAVAVLPLTWRLLRSEREITLAFKSILTVTGLIALYGAYQPVAVALGWPLTDITQAFSWGDSALTRYGETRFYKGVVASFAPRATFAESLHFGAYLAAIFPVTLACWMGRDRLPERWRRWPWAGLTVLFGTVILLTLSRSSWVAAGIGAAIVILATARLRSLVFAIIGGVCLYLGLLVFSQLPTFDATLSPWAMVARRLSAVDLALDPRWRYHEVLNGLFAGNPVWGIGLGDFALQGAALLQMNTLASAHSVWLSHLVEGGLIGIVALGGLIVAVSVPIARGLRAGAQSVWHVPLIGVTAGILAMSVQYLTFGDRFDPHFWFWIAVALRLSSVMQAPLSQSPRGTSHCRVQRIR